MEPMEFPVVDTKKHEFFRKCHLISTFLLINQCSIQILVISILQMNNFIYFCIMTFISSGLKANLLILGKTKQLLKYDDENIHTYLDDLYMFLTEERHFYEKNTMKILLYSHSAFLTSSMLDILSPLFQFLLKGQVTVIEYPGWIPRSTRWNNNFRMHVFTSYRSNSIEYCTVKCS